VETTQQSSRHVELRFGLRAVLLIVAIFMFVLAVILDDNAFDVGMIGLACLAGAMLVSEFSLDRRGPSD
jgi:hypothetical protein